jgi:hypothetical protein
MDVESGRGSSFVRGSAGSGTDHNPRHRKSPRKCFAGKSNSVPWNNWRSQIVSRVPVLRQSQHNIPPPKWTIGDDGVPRVLPDDSFQFGSSDEVKKACVERYTAFMDPSYTADTGPLTDEEIDNGMLALSNEIDDHAPMPDLIPDEGCTYGVGKSPEAMALYVSSYMAK